MKLIELIGGPMDGERIAVSDFAKQYVVLMREPLSRALFAQSPSHKPIELRTGSYSIRGEWAYWDGEL